MAASPLTRTIFLTALLTPGLAFAFPDGAPWDALANPGEACAQCHFGEDPVEESPALSLSGLEGGAVAGETYLVSLSFAPQDAEIVGFLASMRNQDEGAAGVISSDNERVEGSDAAARSTLEGAALENGVAEWSFHWRAPYAPGPVTLSVAANAGNGDASQFGDMVHLKSIDLDVQKK